MLHVSPPKKKHITTNIIHIIVIKLTQTCHLSLVCTYSICKLCICSTVSVIRTHHGFESNTILCVYCIHVEELTCHNKSLSEHFNSIFHNPLMIRLRMSG